LDCWIESSAFFRNNREGGKFSDLVAPELGSASVRVRGCVFANNGDEGFECRLQVPPAAGTGGGKFTVLVQDCEFADNGLEGLVVNIDYGAFPQWNADIDVRGCRAHANAEAGIHLHLDSTSTCLAHRLLVSANGGDGLLVTSHDLPVVGLVSASAFLGNLGAGVRASVGQASILLSHNLLSGNKGGGLVAEIAPAAAASSVAWIQPGPWSNATAHASPTQDEALPEPFLRAAREYAKITGLSGASLVLDTPPAFPPAGPVEISDDGIARAIVSLAGTLLSVDPAPDAPRIPGVLEFFGPGDSVAEDLHPVPGSIALGSGMTPPGGPRVDAGPWGSPLPGPPGKEDPVPGPLFRLGMASPSWNALGSQEELVLFFVGGRPDPAAAPAAVVLVDAQGHPVAISPFVDGDALRVPSPSGGWVTGDVLELHSGLRSANGRPLASPVALPIRTL
jgi:hypothetical protein